MLNLISGWLYSENFKYLGDSDDIFRFYLQWRVAGMQRIYQLIPHRMAYSMEHRVISEWFPISSLKYHAVWSTLFTIPHEGIVPLVYFCLYTVANVWNLRIKLLDNLRNRYNGQRKFCSQPTISIFHKWNNGGHAWQIPNKCIRNHVGCKVCTVLK